MSEDRFNSIDKRFDAIDTRFDRIAQQFGRIDRQFDQVDRRFDQVDRRLDQIDERFGTVDDKLDELRGHMGVLHEDALGRIAAISDGPLATRADVNNIAAKIDELVDRRIVPLEAAVRSLSHERRGRSPRTE